MDLPKKKEKVKTMNSKMTTNSQLSTTEPKNTRIGQNHRNGDYMEGYHQ